MKPAFFILACAMTLVSCSNKAEISVFNNSEVDRTNEMVEICLCRLEKMDPQKLVILDSKKQQIPVQLLYKGETKPQSLLFPVTLKAGQKKEYTVKEGTPLSIASKTFVRFVPERKDDIAWENDRIGYRVYGPALAAEYPSNGIDVWYKRTPQLVIDKWYKNDIAGKASYHEDHGEGLDCYKVGHTLGAGAIAPIAHDSLFVFDHYDRYKILDNGPLRSSFLLYYDNVRFGTHKLKAEVMISIDAGSNLNEAVVNFTGDTAQFNVAAGLCLHDTVQTIYGDAEKGFIGYAENLYSQSKTPVASGRGYTGVIFLTRLSAVKQVSGHIVGISPYNDGEPFRYYFGAGWSKFGYPKDQDWFMYLADKRKALMAPLDIRIYR